VYFGYNQIWQFRFIPVGFLIVMATFIALACVYVVGASRGQDAAARYMKGTTSAFVILAVGDLAWAVVAGELDRFVDVYGWAPFVEMAVLAMLCVGSMWFMGLSYVNSRRN